MTDKMTYNSDEFTRKLQAATDGHSLPKCPFCGGTDYTTPNHVAVVLVADTFASLTIGPSAPCAMVVCQKCGHVDLFALGVLNLLPERVHDSEGENNDK